MHLPNLPSAFDGFTILHLSDLHADMSGPALQRVAELTPDLDYDLCVLTGDYRGRTYGDCEPCLKVVAHLHKALRGDVYGVLGNHDSIAMVPDLEELGIRILLNECVAIRTGSASIYLAGVDDAHFYRADNIEKAAADIPHGCVSILLSHTPEIYRQAAHAGFGLMLSGHTHGGQIACPAGFRSCLKPICRALSALAHGDMRAWLAIPRSGRGLRSSRCALTIGPRSLCTNLCAARLSRADPVSRQRTRDAISRVLRGRTPAQSRLRRQKQAAGKRRKRLQEAATWEPDRAQAPCCSVRAPIAV